MKRKRLPIEKIHINSQTVWILHTSTTEVKQIRSENVHSANSRTTCIINTDDRKTVSICNVYKILIKYIKL